MGESVNWTVPVEHVRFIRQELLDELQIRADQVDQSVRLLAGRKPANDDVDPADYLRTNRRRYQDIDRACDSWLSGGEEHDEFWVLSLSEENMASLMAGCLLTLGERLHGEAEASSRTTDQMRATMREIEWVLADRERLGLDGVPC